MRSGTEFEIASDSGSAIQLAATFAIHARGKELAGPTDQRRGVLLRGICGELGSSSLVQAAMLFWRNRPSHRCRDLEQTVDAWLPLRTPSTFVPASMSEVHLALAQI